MSTSRLALQRRKEQRVKAGLAEFDRLVDTGPSRAIIQKWLDADVLHSRICAGVPLSLDSFYRILRGDGKIRQSTADAIASWTPTTAAQVGSNHVPALGTRRRLMALGALGFSSAMIAEQIDAFKPEGAVRTSRSTITRIRAGKHLGISPRVRAEVAAVYDQLWDQAPDLSTVTNRRAAGYVLGMAAREGWLAPLYLDDDRLEDPTYRPRRPYSTRHGDDPDA